MFDLIIKGGTVIDGEGRAGFTADVGIRGGVITEIGRITDASIRAIDADGLLVTPGFIDLHTHYDGQALWDDLLNPSFENGVTTAFLGNCGVGFAPVRDGMQETLIDLMDGVEEIPGSVLSEGLAWNWNSLPEYLDQLDQAPHSFNLGAIATHGPLRLYVMGDKVERRVAPDPSEIAEMANLLDEAMRAGAWGLSSSRTPVHSSRSGKMTPDFEADFTELRAFAEVIGRYRGIFEFAPMGNVGENLNGLRRDMEFYERLATETETAVHLLISQTDPYHDFWREQLTALDRVAQSGGRMFGQVNGRGIGVMLGLLNTNQFETRETYLKVMELPADQRMAAFREPEVRARILSEADNWEPRREIVATLVNHAYAFAGLDYEPPPEAKVSSIAAREGRSVPEVAYDLMAKDGFVFAPMLNYHDGNLGAAFEMMTHPRCLLAASDAGAHSLTICDGALPSFMLTHWGRDRSRGERLSIERIISMLTAKPADAVGLAGRGRIAVGAVADLNVIDLAALRIKPPRVANDLPAGGERLLQGAEGYRATIVSGQITRENDRDTGVRPGRLLRRGR